MIHVFNVKEYGAVGDGRTMNTAAIQAAIDECSNRMGGTVYFAGGTFLTGTIYMKNNVTILVDISAKLMGSTEIKDYDEKVIKQKYANHEIMDKCLIYGLNCENISFEGNGIIDGNAPNFPKSQEYDRPMLLRLVSCKNVGIKNIRLLNPASWATNLIMCDTVMVNCVEVFSKDMYNGNGLAFDSCQNVFVTNCKLNTSDDCICIQNSQKEHVCKNILINNTIMSSDYSAIKIGTLSSGDIENVTVSNCIINDIKCSGFKLQSAEGGQLRNMAFQNIIMNNVPRPIFLTYNHYRFGTETPLEIPKTGGISNIKFDHMIINNDESQMPDFSSGMVITGTPGFKIDNITISNIDYTAVGGGSAYNGNIESVPELINQRPEFYIFGEKLPSYGFFLRHAKNIDIRDVKINTLQKEERPCIACSDTSNIFICNLDAEDSN